ncbi:hypothetical protein HAV_00391 [Candidatus Hepatincola sp. Av]
MYISKINNKKETLLPLPHKIPLTIKVLFFYSPETLKSYINKEQLIADSNDFCFILANILNHNIVKYKTTVTKVANIEFKDMQQGKEVLSCSEIRSLTANYPKGVYPHLIQLQTAYKANLVVFLPMVKDGNLFFGNAAALGFTTPYEACLSLGRGRELKNKKTSECFPTLLPHELGHILGCNHALTDGAQANGKRVPAYGHIAEDEFGEILYGTMMASIRPRKHIFYYSNPNLFCYPFPVQNTACGEVGISENYKIVEANLPRLAATFNDETFV